MAKEKIVIGIGSETFELKGVELEAYLEQREKDNAELELVRKKQEEQKQLKISAYKKLGLTDEEIQAII